MNFKPENEIKRLRPLAYYLKQDMHESYKTAITKKLSAIIGMPSGNDSQPLDAYRIIGIATIKIQLIEEVNKMIMEQVTSYTLVFPWARELYENWMNQHKMKDSAIEIVLSLRSHGIYSGFYSGCTDPDKCPTFDKKAGMCGVECTDPPEEETCHTENGSTASD